MEGKIFIEKDFYVQPPELPDTADEEEIREAWATWIMENAKERAKHKREWTKSQKPEDLPNFDKANTMVKIGGVWKQRPAMTGYVGSAELGTLETVCFELSKQDRHFQPRGKRAGHKGNKHKFGRNSPSKKEIKRQMILRDKESI